MSAHAALKLVVSRASSPQPAARDHHAAAALTPSSWQGIHHALLRARNARPEADLPPPPRPPALASWWTGGEWQRKDQWLATTEWAHRYGFDALLCELLDRLERSK
jgi:hypothetical protein